MKTGHLDQIGRSIRELVASGDYAGAGRALDEYSAHLTGLVRAHTLSNERASEAASQFRQLTSWILLMARCQTAQLTEQLALQQSTAHYPPAPRSFATLGTEG
jgi:hypothetical protein